MNAQSLKTIIAVNLAVLLLVSVLLIDLLVVANGQKTFIRDKTQAGIMLASEIRPYLFQGRHPQKSRVKNSLDTGDRQNIQRSASLAGISATVIIAANGNILYSDIPNDAPVRDDLIKLAARTYKTGNSCRIFSGKTWGVFLVRNQYLLMSRPILSDNDAVAAGVGMVIDLEAFYARQRGSQAMIFVYGFLNILTLTVLGTYLISRAAVRPIHRLAKIAEGYKEDNEFRPFLDREKNEFRQLSSSLNRMVKRISEDKQQLQASLNNLENANWQIKQRQNELIRAEKLASVGRLSAGIAHEIGNPVGIVLGYLDMLGREGLNEAEKNDYIKRCESEINRINAIIRELLDFSRPSPQAEDATSIHQIITETINMLDVQPLMKSVTTRLCLEAAHHHVYAVPGKLRQVFINLLINAADAVSMNNGAAEEPFVEIATINRSAADTDTHSAGSDFIDVTITDNGPGIADKDMENIFDPFYTTKEPGKGTGLGLSVCFMIVENMGGQINADSPPAGGTTITVRLPVADIET
ncbi:MAG: HAMP domain-containing sensor histidine kinase [Thermodesulfobacteriota bacterium]|nr:HAMP domain-containing sensor histidine kinase [Thermodesulfobacteriota bacterium]